MRTLLLLLMSIAFSPALASEWLCKPMQEKLALRTDALEDEFALILEENGEFLAYSSAPDSRWSWQGKWTKTEQTVAAVGPAVRIWENSIDQSETRKTAEVRGVGTILGVATIPGNEKLLMGLRTSNGVRTSAICTSEGT